MSAFFSHLAALFLVLQCGSDDYRVREEATRSLLRLDKYTDVCQVVLLGASSKDPETARRCRMVAHRFVETIRPTVADYDPAFAFLEFKVEPAWSTTRGHLLDLEVADRRRGLSRTERLRLHLPRCRAATREYIPALLKAGYTRGEIVAMLDRALAAENKALEAEEKRSRFGEDHRRRLPHPDRGRFDKD